MYRAAAVWMLGLVSPYIAFRLIWGNEGPAWYLAVAILVPLATGFYGAHCFWKAVRS